MLLQALENLPGRFGVRGPFLESFKDSLAKTDCCGSWEGETDDSEK